MRTAEPLWCCDQLFRRTGDMEWLRRLYPKAVAYRRDADDWIVYACSWESGQDVSSRFGPQQTGGTIIEHVRPVDLQASVALSAEILSRWATLLVGYAHSGEIQEPTQQASDLSLDAVSWQKIAGEWSTQQDAMHLAPVFCGVAGWDQVEQLHPFLAKPPLHRAWNASCEMLAALLCVLAA